MATTKTHTVKNYCGTKTLIVLDMNSDILSLYKEARKLDIPFAIKQEIGIQVWGASHVAKHVGCNDIYKLLN